MEQSIQDGSQFQLREERKFSNNCAIPRESEQNLCDQDIHLRFSQEDKRVGISSKYIQVKNLWDANNSFQFCGQFIKGPKSDNKSKYCYWISFGIIQLMYFSMLAPYLLMRVSPLLVGFNLIILVTTILLSVITSFKDPGIILRYPLMKALNDGLIPENFQKDLNGDKEQKFCKTCKIWRPKRASHCSACGCCVEVLDHHCPYLNNCIGKRNYKYFIGFLCFIILNGLTILASVIIYITGDFQPGHKPSRDSPVKNTQVARVIIGCIMIATIILFLLLFFLCCFHTYLILNGKTTKEKLTKKDQKESKFLSWLVVGSPNFKGGNQWLSRHQYNLYKQAVREIKNGMVTEHQATLLMSIFHQQREKMKGLNCSGSDSKNVHKASNQNQFPHVEQDFIDSLQIRAGRRSKYETHSIAKNQAEEDQKYDSNIMMKQNFGVQNKLEFASKHLYKEPSESDVPFQVIIKRSGRKLKNSHRISSSESVPYSQTFCKEPDWSQSIKINTDLDHQSSDHFGNNRAYSIRVFRTENEHCIDWYQDRDLAVQSRQSNPLISISSL
ncbi:unnamed protein product [Moneuplotes crassus]|uniref:Palmitoyltransferase n=1 Tax=Euplotes crassus TaxID=5936 RepID=A0AAD1Y2Q2_EUPCR|nr:unnamed protein product [Moneuplotes crassus]